MSSEIRAITEEGDQELIAEWQEEAREQTLETLPAFMDKLINGYAHDYGTICRAIGICAAAAAHAGNKSPQAGITGYQAGFVFWTFEQVWSPFLRGDDVPRWMVFGDDMLYPQYEYKFRSISPEAWEWLQKKAKEGLENQEAAMMIGGKAGEGARRVYDHMKSIADGVVPFGLEVREQ